MLLGKRAGKGESGKVVSGVRVALFPQSLRVEGFLAKGNLCPLCYNVRSSLWPQRGGWAWEDRLAVCGMQSSSQGGRGGVSEDGRNQPTQVWKPSR